MGASKAYHVTASRLDGAHSRIKAREHELTLNIQKGSGEAGFSAAETLLAAVGVRLLTKVNAIGSKMRLDIRRARVELDAMHRDEAPAHRLARAAERRAGGD